MRWSPSCCLLLLFPVLALIAIGIGALIGLASISGVSICHLTMLCH